jgi:hypothetical protein
MDVIGVVLSRGNPVKASAVPFGYFPSIKTDFLDKAFFKARTGERILDQLANCNIGASGPSAFVEDEILEINNFPNLFPSLIWYVNGELAGMFGRLSYEGIQAIQYMTSDDESSSPVNKESSAFDVSNNPFTFVVGIPTNDWDDRSLYVLYCVDPRTFRWRVSKNNQDCDSKGISSGGHGSVLNGRLKQRHKPRQ